MVVKTTRFVTGMMVMLAMPQAAKAQTLHPMSSAEVCGQCHLSIVESWKESAHARSMESRLFQDAMAAAEREMGATARSGCLGCHAPLAVQTGDMALDRKVSWEGVTCDYCHSVRTVDVESPNPRARTEYSLAKSGPLKDAVSGAHPTVFSPVHLSSAVCAPCHEHRNGQGFGVLTTYSEWKASRYGKEGKNCQSCHMAAVAGKVADARFEREPTTSINIHKMAGSRSAAQLNRALKMRLDVTREEGRAKVTVELTNAAAGHFIPTGSPLRQLILDVTARTADGKESRAKKIYARTVKDAAGKVLDKEHFVFLKATGAVIDSRLAPEETRKEVFYFESPAGTATEIKASLSYYYSPFAREKADQRVMFLTKSHRLH